MRMFEITVNNFPPVYKSAETPGKARAAVWRDYTDAFECTFKEFLSISKVRSCSVPAKDGYDYVRRAYGLDVKIGQRIRLKDEGPSTGMEGVVVYPGESTAHVHVKLDDRNDISHVHPSSITIHPTSDTQEMN